MSDVELFVCPLANPLAGKKTTKKCLKAAKKAAKSKSVLRGVREVQKALKKGEKGLCIFAANVSPVEVYAHLPVMCEEIEVPYVFVPSRKDLGEAAGTNRPVSLVFIKAPQDGASFEKAYSKAVEAVQELTAAPSESS